MGDIGYIIEWDIKAQFWDPLVTTKQYYYYCKSKWQNLALKYNPF